VPASRLSSLRHWEAYFRGGAVASCPVGPGDGYTGELREAWVRFFSELPDQARILDIGTGNGAIPLIALACAAALERQFQIHGSDLARIDPVRDVANGASLFAGIQFHPQVASEELPFAAASFDAVTGQYALEYSNVGQALREIDRVLAPGGRAQFILHHADSVVALNARASLQQAGLVLEETMILRKLRRYLDSGQRSAPAAGRAREQFEIALNELREAAGATRNSLMLDVTIDAVRKLAAARGQMAPAALAREVDRFEGEVRASVRRLQDLVRCSQTEAGMRDIARAAVDLGQLVDEPAPQYHAGSNLVGWRLCMRKS
jgi:ubiquinone/menaquinone biosynthesis C-methylase UbiE